MVSPVHGDHRRCQAEIPLIVLCRFPEPVLLSFAQFEREVTSERIRDKIAASKRKGLVGGKDGKLIVVEDEAERVRMIFRRYLEVSGINELVRDLRATQG
jgi:DNA invertase Pin-like site-specific DNA recombinase